MTIALIYKTAAVNFAVERENGVNYDVVKVDIIYFAALMSAPVFEFGYWLVYNLM